MSIYPFSAIHKGRAPKKGPFTILLLLTFQKLKRGQKGLKMYRFDNRMGGRGSEGLSSKRLLNGPFFNPSLIEEEDMSISIWIWKRKTKAQLGQICQYFPILGLI